MRRAVVLLAQSCGIIRYRASRSGHARPRPSRPPGQADGPRGDRAPNPRIKRSRLRGPWTVSCWSARPCRCTCWLSWRSTTDFRSHGGSHHVHSRRRYTARAASRGSPRRAELPDRAEGRTRPLRAHRGLPRRSAGPAGRPTPRPPPPGDDRQHNGISPCLPTRTTAKSTSRFRTGALTSRCAARTSTRIGTPNPAASPPAPRAAGYSPAAPRSWDLGHDQDDERYLTRGVWSPGADPEDTPNPENPLRLAGRPGDCSPPTAAPRGRRPEPAATAPPASSG
jgi:hypothetical protein